MWSYTFRRILATIPTLLAVITVCYLLLHLTPGGPFDSERKVSAAVLANLQAKYHLDLPLWQQYLYYLNSLLHGDLGASFRYADWSVNDLVGKALPVSAAIGGGAILISLFIGVALSATSSSSQADSVAGRWDVTVTIRGIAIPLRLDVSEKGSDFSASLFNGDVPVTPTSARFQDGILTLAFDQLPMTITAEFKDGQLDGRISGRSLDHDGPPFKAVRHAAAPAQATSAPSIAGV